jgi:hypothetical protein
MKHKILGLLVGGLALAATASPAMAASVSVEIEGQTVIQTPITVTTPAHVTKDGGVDCDGTTIAGALEAATGGNWAGSGFSVDTVKGEAHPFGPGGSWAFYLNGNFVNDAACAAAVKDGDQVLFFWSNAFTDPPMGYGEPVLLDAPATMIPGQPTTVSVRETSTYFGPTGFDPGVTTITPSAGATIGGGTAAATTGADGSAQVTVPGGPYTLVANKGARAPSRMAGCATNGHDGFCGTATPISSGVPTPCFTRGNDGLCGSPDKVAANGALTSMPEGKKYAKGKGPRQIAGHVATDPAGLADVRLRLTRNDHGSCTSYDGKKERFVKEKQCGATHGTYFSVGAKQDFTYLLPAKLGRGRYVLDLQVVDQAGNKTAQLARGTSRVVFTVA